MSAAKFELKGLEEGIRKCRALVLKYPKKAKKGLRLWGEGVMTDSRENYCPVQDGVLKASGHVEELEGRIGIDLVYGGEAEAYAIPQHERLDYVHEVGEAKYLEKPLFKAVGTFVQDMHKLAKVGPEDLT